MQITTAHELKQAQTRLSSLWVQRKGVCDAVTAGNREIASIDARIKEIDDTIAAFNERQKAPVISEHAYLRYFERVCGFDLKAIAANILDRQTAELVKTMRTGKFPRDGFRVVAKDGVIVTVEAPETA